MFSLIIPAEGSVQRQPWLTYALAAILLVSFAAQHVAGQPARIRSAASTAAATEAFEKNPMVALDPHFEVALGADWVKQTRRSRAETLRGESRPLLSGFLPRATQEKFDELEQQALTDLASLPAARYGVAGRDTSLPNFVTHAFVNQDPVFVALMIVLLLGAGAAVECAWGSLLFSFLCTASIGAAAWAAASLHQELSPPWFGSVGLMAGLLMASLATSFRASPLLLGAVPLPGWLLLPIWIGAEIARLGEIPATNSVTLIAPAASAGVGFATALFIAVLVPSSRTRGESRKPGGKVPGNDTLLRAQRAREKGQYERAIELLEAEFARVPGNPEVALELWELTRDHGRPHDGSKAILVVLADRLKRGMNAEVVQIWLELAGVLPDIDVQPAPLLRIAQILLAEGEIDEGRWALRRVVERPEPISSVLALRVIRIAGDLDPELTSRVAAIAIADPDLSPIDRDQLAAMAARTEKVAAGEASSSAPVSEEPAAEVSEPVLSEEFPRIKLVRASSKEIVEANRGSVPSDASNWMARGLVEDLSSQLADSSGGSPLPEPAEEPVQEPEESRVQWSDPELSDSGYDEFLDDTMGMHTSLATAPTVSVPIPEPVLEEAPREASEAQVLEVEDLRPLKVVGARPVTLEEGGIALEVDGKGKIALPWERIEALAAGAVRGIGDKPILVIDLVLNWTSSSQEPLRVMRLRSDQFNPRLVVPGAPNSLEAMRALLDAILAATDATPLPDSDAARGRPFADFADLPTYEREALLLDSHR